MLPIKKGIHHQCNPFTAHCDSPCRCRASAHPRDGVENAEQGGLASLFPQPGPRQHSAIVLSLIIANAWLPVTPHVLCWQEHPISGVVGGPLVLCGPTHQINPEEETNGKSSFNSSNPRHPSSRSELGNTTVLCTINETKAGACGMKEDIPASIQPPKTQSRLWKPSQHSPVHRRKQSAL